MRFSVGYARSPPLGLGLLGVIVAPWIGKMSPSLVYQSASLPVITCTSTARVNGTPRAQSASAHTKSPALPGLLRCRHSSSSTKFSYILSVRRTPVGWPVHLMIGSPPSSLPTVNVDG